MFLCLSSPSPLFSFEPLVFDRRGGARMENNFAKETKNAVMSFLISLSLSFSLLAFDLLYHREKRIESDHVRPIISFSPVL